MNIKSKNDKMKRTKKLLQLACTALVFALLFTACEKDAESNEIGTSVDDETAVIQETKLITKYFLGDEVKVQLEDDGTYSLGGSDTRLFDEQLSDSPEKYVDNPEPANSQTALGLGGGVQKWTNSTVVYRLIGMSSSVRSELQKSFNEWTTKTNIRFKERTNESNYVTISSSGDNSNSGVATLGMFGSQGYIRLGTRATAVVIIHEIGHTLGYIHEQNRSDRDSFVRINFQNIQDNAVSQFFKSNSASLVTSQFDINSTMMYGSYTFTKNGQPTITDLNGNVLPRRQAQVSSLDISGTNAIYPPVNGNNNSCGDVEEWSSGTRYFVGDRVTYRGNLYERDFTRWNFIKQCR